MGSENKICFLFHSTHPRRVWRIVLVSLILVQTVSIHTPTKGVTLSTITRFFNLSKFQSTHPRRVWLKLKVSMKLWICFNPHTHEGCDEVQCNTLPWRTSFNPHTHEGCDIWSCLVCVRIMSFNPHTHEGCDWIVSVCSRLFVVFQSTHPRRVWPFALWELSCICCFNPHTHEGCDVNLSLRVQRLNVSIHTPTKGVT